jgi:hypothetical protein
MAMLQLTLLLNAPTMDTSGNTTTALGRRFLIRGDGINVLRLGRHHLFGMLLLRLGTTYACTQEQAMRVVAVFFSNR